LRSLSEVQRLRRAEILIAHHVAHAADVLRHQVRPECGGIGERRVEIPGDPVIAARADLSRELVARHRQRLLARLIDPTAGGAAPEQKRRRSSEHLPTPTVEARTIALISFQGICT